MEDGKRKMDPRLKDVDCLYGCFSFLVFARIIPLYEVRLTEPRPYAPKLKYS